AKAHVAAGGASAAPKAAARAAVRTPAPVIAPAVAEVELPPDQLVGTVLGNYQIEARIGQGSQGGIYRATQTNMGRHVRFYALDRDRAKDPAEIQRFIANASVKANVSHPYLFAVYEAGERDGIYFYSCEYVPCSSLSQLKESGRFLDETTALSAMKVASEVLGYFAKNNITHDLITANGILLTGNNRPRIANIAAHQSVQAFEAQAEMQRLGEIIAAALPPDSQALGVRALAQSLADGQTAAYPNWPALTAAIVSHEPKVAPEDAYKLDAQERAAIRMVEEAKKRQRKGMLINTGVSLGLLALALFSAWWFLLRQKGANVKDFSRTITIPAGEFIYQDGKKITLPAYSIDEYEVTIGQYAEFLKYLEEHPDEAAKFAHPKQPKGKSHVPNGWADQDLNPPMPGYYTRAKRWGRFQEATLDVNCPVFGVDWFDAYAYAKWKGRRLPTEEEWEKAARGTEGFKYPWGNEMDEKRVNSGSDLNPNPKLGGEKDGFKRWSPVDAKKGDKSPYNVMGMAGNVAEWTGSFDTDPKMTSQKIPVIRGGNWRVPDSSVTRRVVVLTDLESNDGLGFRTAGDAPAK
nr:SUMF1/EgtB/PvdO family nonheme iron enzyme [Terrimicrobiaceae bacterium]